MQNRGNKVSKHKNAFKLSVLFSDYVGYLELDLCEVIPLLHWSENHYVMSSMCMKILNVHYTMWAYLACINFSGETQ